jgi:beta-lactamase class C
LDEAFSRYVPEAAAAQRPLTLRQLLTHTSGLPFTFPNGIVTDEAVLKWPALADACLRVLPDTPPGTRVAYSNVGYGLLAVAVERVTNQPFADMLTELVFRPLGIEAYLDHEPPRPTAAVTAPTDTHVGTPLGKWNTPFWRSRGVPWGNMVTTQAGMLTLVNAFRGVPTGFLQPETVGEATRNQTAELGGGLIGWMESPRCPWGLAQSCVVKKHPITSHQKLARTRLAMQGSRVAWCGWIRRWMSHGQSMAHALRTAIGI